MPTQLQLRRGTTSQNNSFTGAAGELSVDTDLDQLRVHDGSTAGGIKVPGTGLALGAAGNTNPATNTVSVGTPANVVIRSATGQSGNVIIGDATATSNFNLDVRGTANAGAITSTSHTSTGNIQGVNITATTAILPDASDGAAIGSASLEWSDLYLADGAQILMGDDQEITLTHVADSGLNLKHVGTGDGKMPTFTLQCGDNNMEADDKLGVINFQAPDEGAGTDAILVAAGIEAVSEGDFSASNNATKLSLKTAASEAATEKLAISSGGDVKVVTDGASMFFGADSEIELRHVADEGLILKHVGTGDGKMPTMTFQAGDNNMEAADKLGVINFQAPDEGAGTDAILVAAGIEAVSEGDFSASSNATKLSFKTAASAAAAETMALSSGGNLTVTGTITDGDGGGPVPPGAVLPYGGATAPTGYLLCNDAAISRSTYSVLFAILSTTYGAGDGTTTFNVPDLRDRLPLGKGTNNSTLGGETTGAAASAVKATASGSASLTTTTGTFATSAKDSSTATALTGVTAGGHTHNLTLPVQVFNYIIKT